MSEMAMKMVSGYFEAKELPVDKYDEDSMRTGFKYEWGTISIFLSFDATDTHVHIVGLDFLHVPQDKFDVMYKALNDCNMLYSHIRFALDNGHAQVIVTDDDVIQLDSCGEECFELAMRMAGVVNDAYPKLMKAMWA